MKVDEIKTRLILEIESWFTKQCHDPYSDYYLFCIESKPEHDGGFLISKKQPANKSYTLALNSRMNKSYTKDQIFNWLMPFINKLPIIE